MTWDTTVSIEGLATALAVLGAAIGYVINLARHWRAEKLDKQLRGTSFVLLELLEQELGNGLTEDELFRAYGSEQTASIRAKYSAMLPSKLSRVLFERRLRQLQFDHMADPTGRDRWRVRARPVDSFERTELQRGVIRDAVRKQFSAGEVAAAAERVLAATNAFRKKEALETLVRMDPSSGLARCKSLLTDGSAEDALVAAELLVELQVR